MDMWSSVVIMNEQKEFWQFWWATHSEVQSVHFAFYLRHLCLLPSGVLLCYIMQVLWHEGKKCIVLPLPLPKEVQINEYTPVNHYHQYDLQCLALKLR